MKLKLKIDELNLQSVVIYKNKYNYILNSSHDLIILFILIILKTSTILH